ncbi:transposase [Cuspidothrix issatschenkoi]|uniref:transposase n=1 Tax=Cuspidothrix issatschenkoi TaxID=230752 RepID=UPI001FAF3959|nr:transposase [Cuspidothrix issatschenkoi]
MRLVERHIIKQNNKWFREIEGKIKTVTITKNCSEQYFAAILFEDGKEKPKSIAEGKVLKYKAENEGKIYQEVDRFFPSSKTCHVCLNQVGSLPLDIRFWTCEKCQTKHDRDINAAINLRDEGLRILRLRLVLSAVEGLTSGTGDKACHPEVSRSNRGRKKSTTVLSAGQEADTVPSGQCG